MTKKSEKSKQKNEKMSPAERENLLLGVMLGRGVRDTAKDWPDLGVLSIVRSEDQSGFLVKIKDNLVERVDHLTLRASISRWTEKLDTPFLLELRHVESLARRWAM
jgi:hypothetical protein